MELLVLVKILLKFLIIWEIYVFAKKTMYINLVVWLVLLVALDRLLKNYVNVKQISLIYLMKIIIYVFVVKIILEQL